ncbi:hypothetical protein BDF22DRAFT_664416 [Syncephalis plumigaleata]|nr:hypothetical protein BDF22DRAFT_664416 [Syncephalis plumigaleata]
MWRTTLLLLLCRILLGFLLVPNSIVPIRQYYVSASIRVYNRQMNATFESRTTDPYQHRMPWYNNTGVLVTPRIVLDSANCEFNKTVPFNFNDTRAILPNIVDSVIVLLNMTDIERSSCTDNTNLMGAIKQYNAWLVSQSFFPVKLILQGMTVKPVDTADLPGGRRNVNNYYYSACAWSGIPIALVSYRNYPLLARHLANMTDPIVVTVTQQLGVWNQAYFATWFTVLMGIYSAITLLFVIYGIIDIVLLIKAGRFTWDLRVMAFICALVSSAGGAVYSFLNDVDARVRVTGLVLSILRVLGVYLVLLLWIRLQAAIDLHKSATAFRISVHVGSSLLMFSQAFRLAGYFLYNMPVVYVGLYILFLYITIVIQCLGAMTFAYCGIKFYLLLRQSKSELARYALLRLCAFSAILSVTAVFITLDIILLVSNDFTQDIAIIMVRRTLRYTAYAIQSICLLYMLCVRIPQQHAKPSESVATLLRKLLNKTREKLYGPITLTKEEPTIASNIEHNALTKTLNDAPSAEDYVGYPSSAIQSITSRVMTDEMSLEQFKNTCNSDDTRCK